jgi:hypothetical protein
MDSSPAPAEPRPTSRGLLVALAGVVVLALGLLAWRASFGLTFADDSYYVIVPMRLAAGARPLADDTSLQSLGFLAAVPFVGAWIAVFGMTGVVLASRLVYVLLASLAEIVVIRSLRPAFSVTIAALCAMPILLSPPFDLVAVSYNTSAMLAFMLAVALGFAAHSRASRSAAVASGVAIALGSVSYPPLAIAGIVLLVTLAIALRSKVLRTMLFAGFGVTLVVAVVWILRPLSAADLANVCRVALAYSEPLLPKLARLGFNLASLLDPLFWPLWIVAGLLTFAEWSDRVRTVLWILLPFAAMLKGVVALLTGSYQAFGAVGAAWVVVFTVAAAAPVLVQARRTGSRQVAWLLSASAPFALVGSATVLLVSQAGLYSGVLIAPFAPLALAVLAGWMTLSAEMATERAVGIAGSAVLAVLVGMMFATQFEGGPVLGLRDRVASGAYAWIATDRADPPRLKALHALEQRLAGPSKRLLVVGEPGPYLLSDARPVTPATWLDPNHLTQITIDYFDRHGYPDLVLVGRGQLGSNAAPDGLLRRLLPGYRAMETTGGYTAYVRR